MTNASADLFDATEERLIQAARYSEWDELVIKALALDAMITIDTFEDDKKRHRYEGRIVNQSWFTEQNKVSVSNLIIDGKKQEDSCSRVFDYQEMLNFFLSGEQTPLPLTPDNSNPEQKISSEQDAQSLLAVSYTHLTLPTNREV